MTRIVRTPEGVEIDPTGKMAGRGAYIHNARPCWEKSLTGVLQRALKTEISGEELERLSAFMASLPEEEGPAE
jgi:predicted RNA-binding protein YlxR (DUF448 family)